MKFGFSPNRSEIYEDALYVLLKKWDSSRQIYRNDIYKGLSNKIKKQLLASVAYHSFKAGEYFMPQKQVNQLIGDYIEDLLVRCRQTLRMFANLPLWNLKTSFTVLSTNGVGAMLLIIFLHIGKSITFQN